MISTAQPKVTSPVGEYYLRGVMEMASGFKLNDDHSFEFFFSYGALDRMGGGRWKQQGDSIVFNSNDKPGPDFSLLESKKTEQKGITIQVVDSNSIFLKSVYCIITGEGKTQEALADAEGVINFKSQKIDRMEFMFEFCPEKKSVFNFGATDNNSFQIGFQPWMMDVFFKDAVLKLKENKLVGQHPLLREGDYEFRRANHEEN